MNNMKIGNIYAAIPSGLSMPGEQLRKIGYSGKPDVNTRMKELTNGTGNVPKYNKFTASSHINGEDAYLYKNVVHARSLEDSLHKRYKELGLLVEREIFDFGRETGHSEYDSITNIDEKVFKISDPVYNEHTSIHDKFLNVFSAICGKTRDIDKIDKIIALYEKKNYRSGENYLASVYTNTDDPNLEITPRELIIDQLNDCIKHVILRTANIIVISSIEHVLLLMFRYNIDPNAITFFSNNTFFQQIAETLGIVAKRFGEFKNHNDTYNLIIGTPIEEHKNIWEKVITHGMPRLSENGIMSILVSKSWGSFGGNNERKERKLLSKYIKPYKVIAVDTTAHKYFKKLPCNVLTIQNTPYIKTHQTKYKTDDGVKMIDMHDYKCHTPDYPQYEFSTLFNRLYDNTHHVWITEDPYDGKSRSTMGSEPNKSDTKVGRGEYSMKKSDTHQYKAYHSNNKETMYRYTTSNHILPSHQKAKIFISNSGISNELFHLENNCSNTDASMCLCVDDYDIKTRESILSMLNSNFIRFLILKVYNWSSFLNMNFIQMIPIPFDTNTEKWTDNDVMDKLLTREERYIIKPLFEKWNEERNTYMTKDTS